MQAVRSSGHTLPGNTRLWTIQTLDAWQTLQSRGILRTDARRSYRRFLPAYRWIADQLAKRVGPSPRGVRYPLWAWYRRVMPRRWSEGDSAQVLIVFDAPDQDILLSDFAAWHVPLSRCYMARSETDDSRFSRELARRGIEWSDALEVPDVQQRIEASWERLFDPLRKSPYSSPGGWTQAVFWELRLEQVRRVRILEPKPLTARELAMSAPERVRRLK